MEPTLKALGKLAFGAESFIRALSRFQEINSVFPQIEFWSKDHSDFNAVSGFDDAKQFEGYIEVYDGTIAPLKGRFLRCCEALCKHYSPPWIAFGYVPRAFESIQGFVEHLLAFALDYITVHEFSHVIRGHVRHFSHAGRFAMAEAFTSENRCSIQIPPALSQAVELDADNCANALLVRFVPEITRLSRRYGKGSIEASLTAICFAVRVVFIAFVERDPSGTDGNAGSFKKFHKERWHPHPACREMFMHHCFKNGFTFPNQRSMLLRVTQTSRELLSLLIAEDVVDERLFVPLLRHGNDLKLTTNEIFGRSRKLFREVDAKRPSLFTRYLAGK